MELDDLKRSWEEYDKKLTENLLLNKELLRRSNLDRSKREMNVTLKWLSFDMIASVIFFVLCCYWTILYCRGALYLVCGGSVTLFMLLSCINDARLSGILQKIDYYNTPVLELQKQLVKFEKAYKYGTKIVILILPVLLVAGLIFATKILEGLGMPSVTFHSWPTMFVINCVFVIAVTYPLLFWLNRTFIDKRLNAARRFLAELQEFEKECTPAQGKYLIGN